MKTIFSAFSSLNDQSGLPSVRRALSDLERDFHAILPDTPGKPLTVRLDTALREAESYEIRIGATGADIAAADELGAIYGIYRFSAEFLGVDPFWFWKDVYPARREEPLSLESLTIRSEPACFRFRGWFVNDEDLLTAWHDSSGRRNIDYPYYGTVIADDIAQALYEAVLRSGGNLIIPASFLDITNPPEAKLIEMAVERGLYVSQHHIEPLGVSHFGFENYWKSKGLHEIFAYGSNPDRVRECWRHFARIWRKIAGDKVIWQLGLRGKGDRSIWHSDPSVTRDNAAEFILQALRDQLSIIRETDPRANPPMTLTLWSEMSALMAEGVLRLPPEIITVFSDSGSTQEMQSDFLDIPRNTLGKDRGVYFHPAFWAGGAHLYAGVSPDHVERVFRQVIGQGDTAYAIINVCNVREHLIAIEASMRMMNRPDRFASARFLQEFGGICGSLYREYFNSYHAGKFHGFFQDGCISLMLAARGKYVEAGVHGSEGPRNAAKLFRAGADRFEAVAEAVPGDSPEFIRLNLGAQSRLMSRLYRYAAALLEDDLKEALKQLDLYLEDRKVLEQGKWTGWYKGDRKCAWPVKRSDLSKLISDERE